MEKQLRNISITHETATVSVREQFHISTEGRDQLHVEILLAFPGISSLMLLSTCNRMEIYFESARITAVELFNFYIKYLNIGPEAQLGKYFMIRENTGETLKYLLEVSNGLRSSVMGDRQIISQIKEAYHYSFSHKIHGTLLERAMQAVHRSHKKVSNYTTFKQGSTSTAYQALKLIEKGFGKENLLSKKLLILGTGDIVQDLLRYLPKFPFEGVSIANRTEQKAQGLAREHHLNVYAWSEVEAQNFQNFDCIITAVSNRTSLVKGGFNFTRKSIAVDLAMPSNIHNEVTKNYPVTLHNLDEVGQKVNQTDEIQQQGFQEVKAIVQREVSDFLHWIKNRQQRALRYALESKQTF